jgi:hypothetical protein
MAREPDLNVPEMPEGEVPEGGVIVAPGIRSGRLFPRSPSIPRDPKGKVASRGEDRVLQGFRIPGSVGLADASSTPVGATLAGATPVSAIVLRYKG